MSFRVRSSALVLLLLLIGFGGGCGGGVDGPAHGADTPVVTSVVPRVVSRAAAARLTIGGLGFEGARSAEVADRDTGAVHALIDLDLVSGTVLRATLPAGGPTGRFDVRITTPAGTNRASAVTLQVVAGAVVQSIDPPRGFNDEATGVVIEGAGLAGTTSVALSDPGGTSLTNLVVESDGRLRVDVPSAVAPGTWAVHVTSGGGTRAAGDVRFEARNLADPDRPGAFGVGYEDVVVPGASGDAPAARVYYPALESGEDATLDAVRAPYPVVVFNHAFKPPLVAGGIDHRGYAHLCGHLASFGYVVISTDLAPNNDLLGSAIENVQRDADDARAALDYLATRNQSPGDRLAGRLDPTRAAVGGHSRGGDASLVACADEAASRGVAARLRAGFVLGAPSFDPRSGGSRLPLGDFTSVAFLALGASRDGIVPYADQLDLYAQAGTPAMVAEILGGNHSQYTDTGQMLPFDESATIPLATQQAIVQRYVTALLGAHLKDRTDLFGPYLGAGAVFTGDDRLRGRLSK